MTTFSEENILAIITSYPNLNTKEVIISESDFMAIIISDRTEKDQMRG